MINPTPHWPRLAGHPLLDALNTVGGPLGDRHEQELLTAPGDLVAWADEAGLFDPGRLAAFQNGLKTNGEAALDRFRQFRESAFAMFNAVCGPDDAPQEALIALADAIAQAKRRSVLALEDRHPVWRLSDPDRPAESLTDQLALMADAFLAGPDIGRLRRCRRCSWLFLAPTRGRPRIWCSMQICGNRDKQARHYRRLKRA